MLPTGSVWFLSPGFARVRIHVALRAPVVALGVVWSRPLMRGYVGSILLRVTTDTRFTRVARRASPIGSGSRDGSGSGASSTCRATRDSGTASSSIAGTPATSVSATSVTTTSVRNTSVTSASVTPASSMAASSLSQDLQGQRKRQGCRERDEEDAFQ